MKKYDVVYQDLQKFYQKYKKGEGIGGGQYGKVDNLEIIQKEKTEEEQQTDYVVKSLDILKYDQKLQEREIIALQQVNFLPDYLRKQVIKLKEAFIDKEEKKIYLIIPKAEICFHRQILLNIDKKEHYEPKNLCYKLSCVLLGLQTLDLLGILHRDMKPSNMLVMKDGSIVLADFGTSKQFTTENTVLTGTPTYHSPELLKKFGIHFDNSQRYFSEASIKMFKDCDLYAIGQSFVFAASLLPYPVYNPQTFAKMEKDKVYSPQFINLLKVMVKKDPSERYSLKDCLNIVENLPDWKMELKKKNY